MALKALRIFSKFKKPLKLNHRQQIRIFGAKGQSTYI
jgi:hypothetical protein